MIPFEQFSKAMNMEGIEGEPSLYSRIKWKIGEYIPYSISIPWNDRDYFHPIRCYQKVCKIISYVPILWNDWDWDYVCLYNLMAFKLKKMKEHHRECQTIADWETVANEIEVAEGALRRLAADDYCAKAHEEHRKKFKEGDSFEDRFIPVEEEKDSRYRTMKPMSDEERESFRSIMDSEEECRQKDLAIFCKMFTEYSRGWWD